MSLTANPTSQPVSPGAEPATSERPLQLWFDGEIASSEALHAPLTTHAMHYGSGVFEGMRSYATRDGAAVFRLPEHLERMRKGAELLGIRFDVQQAAAATLQVLRSNGHRDAYIRPLAWVGGGSFGLDIGAQPHHLMVASTATNVHLGGSRARLTVSKWRRNPATSLPPLKLCGAYVNSILAKREAKGRGFDEALFVDENGLVVECTGANVFFAKNGQLIAVDHRDALPGITRNTLIALTGARSRPATRAELLDADEVFVCGTAAEVSAIAALDQREYGDNPITRELAALYARVVRGEVPQYTHWLTAT